MRQPSQGWRGDGPTPRPAWRYPPGALPVGITDDTAGDPMDDPLLSACLIVRDEEDQLAACLTSLSGLVDEVIVHDTGSTDMSVTVAGAHGAVVRVGTWEDDFAAARNAALQACRGRWILHVDADEVVRADPVKVRAALRSTRADALLVDIENLLDGGVGSSRFRATRLFRRSRAQWRGRVHEQVVARAGQPALRVEDAGRGLLIVHYGYQAEFMANRDKAARNLRLARMAVDDASGSAPAAAAAASLDLGRALVAAGDHAEAILHLSKAASDGAPDVARAALRLAVGSALANADVDSAYHFANCLRAVSYRQGVADLLEGQAALAAGRPASALELFDRITDPATDLVDDDGFGAPVGLLAVERGLALGLLARWEEAADAFSAAVFEHAAWDGNIEALVIAWQRSGRDVAELAGRLSIGLGPDLTAQLRTMNAETADMFSEAWFLGAGDPPPAALLDGAAAVARRLPAERALAWSIRLRAAGRDDDCPLIARAMDDRLDPCERVLSAATAQAAFTDPRAGEAVAAAAADVPADAIGDILLALDDLAPAVLPAAVLGAASTPERSLVVAGLLDRFGMPEEAQAIRELGNSL